MSSFILLILVSLHYTLAERSFTLVLDTTVSMSEEISVIKANIGQLVQGSETNNFEKFVLLPFQDTPIEPALVTQSAQEFTSRLNYLTTSGGNDCPENSLTGIEAALKTSGKQANIFVFTDAYAKDYDKFRTVEALCRETHSQVMIFLSGFCFPSRTGPVGSLQVYYDVAKACSGAVFRFNTTVDLRQAFRYMREILNTEWTRVTAYEKFFDRQELSFSANSFTTDIMIVLSGSHPNFQIIGMNSQSLRSESVVDTGSSLVIRFRQPDAGQYIVSVQGQGPISVTLYERNYVPFQFGFSTKSPRSIAETSRKPIAGYTNYILINVDDSIKLRAIEWLNLGDSVKQILYLKENPSGSYVSSVFVETGKMFQFWIIGQETATQQEIKGSSKLLSPQTIVNEDELELTAPEVQILDSDLGLVNYGAGLTLACKVTAYPTPEVFWMESDHQKYLPAETIVLEIPTTHISYVMMNVTKNTTISCNARNSEGTESKTIDVFVNRTLTFEVTHRPEDASVEYGSEHSIYCQVDAYPEATIQWYLNESIISTENIEDSRVSLVDNALVIKNMGFEDIGSYECRASNGVESESMTASIEISGVESPEIETGETQKNLKIGDWMEIECRISRGKPDPEINWKHKKPDDFDFTSLPDDVSTEDNKLKITSVEKTHAGIYKCFASNALGEDTKEFTVKIQSPPAIRNTERETLVVREGNNVELLCDVESSPAATVRWEMSQDDLSIPFNHRHRTDERNALHFQALWKDSGNYHCVAENIVGKAERTVIVNVLVPPYIETPKSNTTYATTGSDVELTCNVLYGNPAPSIRWQFIAKDSVSRILSRENSSSNLHLRNVSRSDEGSYLCLAENQIDSDSFTFYLIVH